SAGDVTENAPQAIAELPEAMGRIFFFSGIRPQRLRDPFARRALGRMAGNEEQELPGLCLADAWPRPYLPATHKDAWRSKALDPDRRGAQFSRFADADNAAALDLRCWFGCFGRHCCLGCFVGLRLRMV